MHGFAVADKSLKHEDDSATNKSLKNADDSSPEMSTLPMDTVFLSKQCFFLTIFTNNSFTNNNNLHSRSWTAAMNILFSSINRFGRDLLLLGMY